MGQRCCVRVACWRTRVHRRVVRRRGGRVARATAEHRGGRRRVAHYVFSNAELERIYKLLKFRNNFMKILNF